jgi:hypothetical protein
MGRSNCCAISWGLTFGTAWAAPGQHGVQIERQRRGEPLPRKSLVELYEATDPARGSDAEENKLDAARQAVSIWWYLWGELLLWAQSHLAGMRCSSRIPSLESGLRKLLGTQFTVDSHVVEYVGRLLFGEPCQRQRSGARGNSLVFEATGATSTTFSRMRCWSRLPTPSMSLTQRQALSCRRRRPS